MTTTPELRARRAGYQRAYRAKHPEKTRAYERAYRAAHPEKFKEAERRYYAENPERRKLQMRRSTYKNLYGITLDDYDRMFDAQGGVCLICGSPPEPDKRLHVDHAHGKLDPVRGLICFRCNSGLGMFRDDSSLLVKAAEYLNQGG